MNDLDIIVILIYEGESNVRVILQMKVISGLNSPNFFLDPLIRLHINHLESLQLVRFCSK